MFNGVDDFHDFILNLTTDLENSEAKLGVEKLGKHGGLAINDGTLYLKKPDRGGRWPTIIPKVDARIKILYRGQPLEKPMVVDDVQGFELQVVQTPSHSSFQITVSPDKMEVWLITNFCPGMKYRIGDAVYTNQLIVQAEAEKMVMPEPINPDLVFQQLDELGIEAQLYMDQIITACQNRISDRTLIGVGIPPKKPVDGRIEVVYDQYCKREPVEEGGRINLLDRSRINSVEPGQVLAYWHPPVEGEGGQDVFGHLIKPQTPKQNRLYVGQGARLIGDGTVAIAEIAGRPCFERGRLCVKPQLIIPSDVDISTGNIEFKGDIYIAGDVKESLQVKAGGRVEIRGSVYHATIIADNDVIINKNLIGGQIKAGGELIDFQKLASLIGEIIPQLQDLKSAFLQLQGHPKFSVYDLKVRGDGYLIKLILEMRFAQIPILCNKILELLPTQSLTEEDDKFWSLLRHLAKRFIGANPLKIKAITEIDTYIDALAKIHAGLSETIHTSANISVYYCQNALLEATGDIVVRGPLVYGCSMVAGGRIEMAGSCRGGSYFAASEINVQSAGLNERVKTDFAVKENGTIIGQTLHPGVRLTIGQATMAIEETKRNIKLRFAQGRWIK